MTSKWDPASYSRQDPLVKGLLEPARPIPDIVEEAIDWRRGEILRLEREIGTLQDVQKLRAAATRDVA